MTERSFAVMLNENLDYSLLMEETIKRNFLLQKVRRDDTWRGGPLPVPFKGAKASSTKMGTLTPEDEISENLFVKGYVEEQKEIWGSMIFRHKDLIQHSSQGAKQKKGMVDEQSFLQSFPDQLEEFIMDMKEKTSCGLLTGAQYDKVTADADANDGVLPVARVEYYQIGMKIIINDDNDSPITCYVKSINMNTEKIVVATTAALTTVVDFSSATGQEVLVADSPVIYLDGAEDSSLAFTSLISQILPEGIRGAPADVFGITKTAYPYTQAVVQDGSSWDAASFMDNIFAYWMKVKRIGKGNPTDCLIGYELMGVIMARLELQSGAYKHVGTKVNKYGWTEITVQGIKGVLKFVAVNEMPDDIALILDWSGIKLHSNGGFRVHEDMNGNNYYTIRTVNGYRYIVDICFFGELCVNRPSYQGAVYGLDISIV